MKKDKSVFSVSKKKMYITSAIISIIVATIISFFFGKIVEVLKTAEDFKNIKASDLALWLIPIIFIIIYISILAVIVICDGNSKKNK